MTERPPRPPVHVHDAHVRLLLAALVGLVVLFGLAPVVPRLETRLLLAWDAFALVELTLAWTAITRVQHQRIQLLAGREDVSRTVITALIVTAATVSLFGVALLGPGQAVPADQRWLYLVISVVAVACSWCLIHTVFAFHYAHLFYQPRAAPNGTPRAGGLVFPPHVVHPNYIDFAYLSFGIGMTFQVADVQVVTRGMRLAVLGHSLLSFLFNTLILAFAVNVVASMRP